MCRFLSLILRHCMTSDLLSPSVSPPRVLVVDDHVDAAELLAEFLRMEGFEVDCAHDGEQARRCWGASRVQAAVIDARLPDLSGGELARQLRALPHGAAARLIALSGDDPDRVALTGPFDHCLAKPADLDRLIDLLRDLPEVA